MKGKRDRRLCFHVPQKLEAAGAAAPSHVPFEGYNLLLSRRFEEAIDTFLESQRRTGPTDDWR